MQNFTFHSQIQLDMKGRIFIIYLQNIFLLNIYIPNILIVFQELDFIYFYFGDYRFMNVKYVIN